MKTKKLQICLTMITLLIGTLLVSCDGKQETSLNNEMELDDTRVLDLCFVALSNDGKLIDLHIVRNVENQVYITAEPSYLKTSDQEIPEYIIIADGVEFVDNSFTLPETSESCWIFEVDLGNPVTTKAPTGGGKLVAECNCMAPDGNCTVTYVMHSNSVFTAYCNSNPGNPCQLSGIDGQCAWTLPEVIISMKKNKTAFKTTKIIVTSDFIDYNGQLYE